MQVRAWGGMMTSTACPGIGYRKENPWSRLPCVKRLRGAIDIVYFPITSGQDGPLASRCELSHIWPAHPVGS